MLKLEFTGQFKTDHARQLIANGVMAVSEGANMPSTPEDRKSTRLNSSHGDESRMPSSA